MDHRGVGYVVDVLVFALLLSIASLLMLNVSPIDSRTEDTRHAASFAQSTLLAFQQATADEFGGFEYELCWLGLNVPILEGRRELSHKTLAQLLVEDAFLNMRVEVENIDFSFFNPNQKMDEELGEFIKSALGRLMGGRFGYRLVARSEPLDIEAVRVYFEKKIEELNNPRRKLCSESILMTLPTQREELRKRIERVLGIQLPEPDPDIGVEITLELWSQ